MVDDVLKTAEGITNYGLATVISAVFLIMALTVIILVFKWFKRVMESLITQNQSSIDEILSYSKTQSAMLRVLTDSFQNESLLRIRTIVNLYIENSIDKTCRLIKKVREENNIKDKEKTHEKVKTRIDAAIKQAKIELSNFNYREKSLDECVPDDVADSLVAVVEQELYHPEGPNNYRAYANVKTAYEVIKVKIYEQLS